MQDQLMTIILNERGQDAELHLETNRAAGRQR